SRLGAQVTVVELLDRIVPTMDRGMAVQLQRALERQGIHFQLEVSARRAERMERGVRVSLSTKGGPTALAVDVLLVAIGRPANTEGLGAESIGSEFDDRGRIVVNERFETSIPGIFAIGDVIAGPMLAHKASEEGVAAVEMMAGQGGHVNYDAIPSVVYTWPEL